MNRCEVCQKDAFRKCAGCLRVVYCTKQHQRDDWIKHKRVCRAFKVGGDQRYLTATRSLNPGDNVLQEPPLIWGPCATTVPVCLGCAKKVDETSRPCIKCGWPVCDELCEKSPSHLPECRYTSQRGERVVIQRFGTPHPMYKCVTVLRCLYLKQFLPKTWARVEKLKPGTLPERRDEWVKMAEFIRRFFKLYTVFSFDEVVDVCGLVMINSREVPLTQPPHVAIFGTASLLEHNCSANCTISFTNLGHIIVSAAKPIKEGDHLTVSYTNPLWGTSSRRYHLYQHKFLWCHCQRCQDPTEFGTCFSALKCQTCDGCLLPPSFTDLKKMPDWVCNLCGHTVSSYLVYDILERVEKDLNELDKSDVEGCKQFLATCRGLLHENHFFCTRVKYFLALLWQTGVETLSDEDLVTKLEFCQDLEGLVKVLAPAEKRVLGRVLFEKSGAVRELGRRSDSGKLVFSLNESKQSLEEVVSLLKNEPEVLPEGKIRVTAAKNLQEVTETLRQL